MTIFKFADMDKIKIKGKTICFCKFCKGKDKRKDIKHLKLFGKHGLEFYLMINKKDKEISLERKF